jgi:hypothetical protein
MRLRLRLVGVCMDRVMKAKDKGQGYIIKTSTLNKQN